MNDCVNEVEATRIMQDANQLVETDGTVGGGRGPVGWSWRWRWRWRVYGERQEALIAAF
jgi:hypothetical protein